MFWNDFCVFGKTRASEILPFDFDLLDKENERLRSQWQTYVNIRCNLFESKLKGLLSGGDGDKKGPNYYKVISKDRGRIGTLESRQNSVVKELTSICKNSGKLDNRLRFHILHSGIHAFLSNLQIAYQWKKQVGEDKYTIKYTSVNDHKEQFNKTLKSCFDDGLKAIEYNDTSFNHLNSGEMIEFVTVYSTQDIVNPYHHAVSRSGIEYFIASRMAYAIMCDLFLNEKDNVVFGNLKSSLFRFLWDYCIYESLHSYSAPKHQVGEHAATESLQISLFFLLKNYFIDPKFLDSYRGLGGYGLLHHAAQNSYAFYSEILMNHGFDCLDKDHIGMTPHQICTEKDENVILSKMAKQLQGTARFLFFVG